MSVGITVQIGSVPFHPRIRRLDVEVVALLSSEGVVRGGPGEGGGRVASVPGPVEVILLVLCPATDGILWGGCKGVVYSTRFLLCW